jgi:uncharacterized damage-inducible protein DinB
MITPAYIRTMAALQCRDESPALRRHGAALGCRASGSARGILGLDPRHLTHILWGDQQWMSRFDAWPKPTTPIQESAQMIEDFAVLGAGREKADTDISRWAAKVDEAWLAEDLTWFSGAAGREMRAPKGLLVTHFFNHQTHHRGQVHAMLTAAGQETGDTDLFLLVPEIVGRA